MQIARRGKIIIPVIKVKGACQNQFTKCKKKNLGLHTKLNVCRLTNYSCNHSITFKIILAQTFLLLTLFLFFLDWSFWHGNGRVLREQSTCFWTHGFRRTHAQTALSWFPPFSSQISPLSSLPRPTQHPRSYLVLKGNHCMYLFHSHPSNKLVAFLCIFATKHALPRHNTFTSVIIQYCIENVTIHFLKPFKVAMVDISQ